MPTALAPTVNRVGNPTFAVIGFNLSTDAGAVSVLFLLLLIVATYRSRWPALAPTLAALGTLLATWDYLQTEGTGSLFAHYGLEVTLFWIAALLASAYRRTRRRLLERSDRFVTLLNTAVDGVILIDDRGRVLDYNPACERLFGYPRDEVLNRNVNMLMPSPYREEHDSYLQRYRRTREKRIIGIGREVEGRRKDGTTFPLDLSVGEAQQGDSTIFIGIIRDATARRVAAAELLAAKEAAEAANRAKSIFLANMSHEIRTPMNAVLGYTQLLETEPALPAEAREAVRSIKNAGRHLMSLISDILDLSKIEAGAERVEDEDFALEGLLEGLGDIFGVRCEEKGLYWRIERCFRNGQVRGDQRKLRQILINLLGNAVKFTEVGGVTLRVEERGPRFRFEVIDTGPGIEVEVHEQIFKPFQQAEQGIKKGGTGLGLSIARRLAEIMGAEIRLESERRRGSRFLFDLALPGAREPVPTSSSDAAPTGRIAASTTVRALVIDDAEDNRDIAARMLRRIGVEVTLAANGEEAIAHIERSLPDIVFMDVRMPVRDGIDALRQLRGRWPDQHIVCIAMSASGVSQGRRYYLDLGFDDYIAKPFYLERLIECVREHLGVAFEENPPALAPDVAIARNPEVQSLKLPAQIRQRLRQAARVNAFTEIEAILFELKQRGAPASHRADYLHALLARYDRDALLEAIEGATDE